MKKYFTKALAVLLSLTFVIGFAVMALPASAEEVALTFEAESTAYTAYKTDGSELTGAAKAGVKYIDSTETCDCIHFTNAELDTISYTLNVEQAGKYELSIGYRLNWNYYAKGTVSVNGNTLDTTFTTRSTTANDNKDNNRVSLFSFGEVDLTQGENIVTLKVNEKASDASKTQIMLDKFTLTLIEADNGGDEEVLLKTNKTQYIEGEPVIVNAIGSGKDWVGIYTPEGTQSLYWDYVESHGSGKDFSIFVWGNKAKDAPARLSAGTYIVRLMPNDQTDLSLALAEIEITIVEASADQLLSVNKNVFAVGEAINVTALGYCKDWVGIYRPGDEHSLYWEYVATVGAGESFDITTEAQRNDNVPAVLTAGTYIIRLMPNDTSDTNQALAEIEVTVKNIYESETTPFKATDSNGDIIATSNEKGTWAWKLDFNKTGISGPISGELAYFRSGGVGGTVEYTVNVAEAGLYALNWAFRPHDASYCTVQVLVNGVEVGAPIDHNNGALVNGSANKASVMKTATVGVAAFVEGENTVTFKMVAAKSDGDMSKSGFASDYIELIPVDAKAEITKGSVSEYEVQSGKDVEIELNVTSDELLAVLIDGVALTEEQFVFENGKLTVKADLLETLAQEKHSVVIASTKGDLSAELNVVKATETGDAAALLLVLAVISLASIAFVASKRKAVR